MIGTLLETVVEQEAEEPPEESLETELETEEPKKPLLPTLIRYSSLEEQLMEEISYSAPLDLYQEADAEDYEPVSAHQKDTADTLDEEAKEQLQESKYEFLEPSENFEEKRRLGMWILFNPAEYAFLESFHNLDRDSDYNTA